MQSLLNKQKILETLLDSYTCKIEGCNTVTNSSQKMLSHLTLQVLVYSALSVFTCQTSNLLMDYIAILKHSTRVFFIVLRLNNRKLLKRVPKQKL